MPEYAWLDFAYGVWHLVTTSENDRVRFWTDRESALAELEEDGWIVIGPFPRRYRGRWRLMALR